MAAPSTAIYSYTGEWIAKGVHRTHWAPTVSGAGLAQSAPQLPDKTVIVSGPTGGTTAVTIQGSNATTATAGYFALNSAAATGGALSGLTAAGVFTILENTRWIRPLLTTATRADVTITMIERADIR